MERPWLTSLTFLGFQLNGSLEEGYLGDGDHGLTFDEVYDGLENGTLWKVIKKRVPDIDLALFTDSDPNLGNAVIAALQEAAAGMRGREEKYGLQANGLSLLIAYVFEAIQQGYWEPARAEHDKRYKGK